MGGSNKEETKTGAICAHFGNLCDFPTCYHCMQHPYKTEKNTNNAKAREK